MYDIDEIINFTFPTCDYVNFLYYLKTETLIASYFDIVVGDKTKDAYEAAIGGGKERKAIMHQNEASLDKLLIAFAALHFNGRK